MKVEGGFSGRTNKLVDGCYSFWVGGVFPILESYLANETDSLSDRYYSYDQDRLQRYILLCCQNFKDGGLRDKPSKRPDLYHTCYCLSGLAVSQCTYRLSRENGHDIVAIRKKPVH